VRSTEKIKKLIRNLNLDVYTNSEADQSVLSELLQAQEKSHKTEPAFASPTIRRKTMFAGKRTWKVAALVAAVIGVGAISVVGVSIGRYYYKGKTDAGVHIFHSEDWETVVTLDDKQVTDVEQTRQDLEEIEGLRQQGKNGADLGKQDLERTSARVRRQWRAVSSPSNENGTASATEPKSSGPLATPRTSSSLKTEFPPPDTKAGPDWLGFFYALLQATRCNLFGVCAL
jgi:hypothetical protein